MHHLIPRERVRTTTCPPPPPPPPPPPLPHLPTPPEPRGGSEAVLRLQVLRELTRVDFAVVPEELQVGVEPGIKRTRPSQREGGPVERADAPHGQGAWQLLPLQSPFPHLAWDAPPLDEGAHRRGGERVQGEKVEGDEAFCAAHHQHPVARPPRIGRAQDPPQTLKPDEGHIHFPEPPGLPSGPHELPPPPGAGSLSPTLPCAQGRAPLQGGGAAGFARSG